jgi:hypothetical protein
VRGWLPNFGVFIEPIWMINLIVHCTFFLGSGTTLPNFGVFIEPIWMINLIVHCTFFLGSGTTAQFRKQTSIQTLT